MSKQQLKGPHIINLKQIAFVFVFAILWFCSIQRIPFAGDAPDGMVLIPAGEFEMGSDTGKNNERPVHTVYLDAFYMDMYEVTNAQYKVFIEANPEWQKENIPPAFHDGVYLRLWDGNTYPEGKADHPVIYVSWYAAMAYAEWAGKRLPTEAEWEKARARRTARESVSLGRYCMRQPTQTTDGTTTLLSLSGNIHPTATVYTIWQATSPSGVLMNTIRISTRHPHVKTHSQAGRSKRLSIISKT